MTPQPPLDDDVAELYGQAYRDGRCGSDAWGDLDRWHDLGLG